MAEDSGIPESAVDYETHESAGQPRVSPRRRRLNTLGWCSGIVLVPLATSYLCMNEEVQQLVAETIAALKVQYLGLLREWLGGNHALYFALNAVGVPCVISCLYLHCVDSELMSEAANLRVLNVISALWALISLFITDAVTAGFIEIASEFQSVYHAIMVQAFGVVAFISFLVITIASVFAREKPPS